MDRVGANALDRVTRAAAGEIPFGALVKRSAAGTIVVAVDGADTTQLEGVAEDCVVEKTKKYKYATYDSVPVITMGRVQLNIKEAAVTSGLYLKITNDQGMVASETSGNWTEGTSVARAIEDAGGTATTAGLAVSAGSTSVTVTSTSDFSAGDRVYLDSGTEDTTSEIATIKSIDSSTTLTLEEATTNAFSSKNMHKIYQVEALLMI